MDNAILIQAKDFIKLGKLQPAIELLFSSFSTLRIDSPNCHLLENELIGISQNLSSVNDKINKNLIGQEQHLIEYSKITDTLLSFIDKMRFEFRSVEAEHIFSEIYFDSTLTHEKTTSCIEITIDRDWNSYTLEEQALLLKAISILLKINDKEIRIVKKRPGSVKLTLELPSEKALLLKKFIDDGKLEQFHVIKSKWSREENIFILEEGNKIRTLIEPFLSANYNFKSAMEDGYFVPFSLQRRELSKFNNFVHHDFKYIDNIFKSEAYLKMVARDIFEHFKSTRNKFNGKALVLVSNVNTANYLSQSINELEEINGEIAVSITSEKKGVNNNYLISQLNLKSSKSRIVISVNMLLTSYNNPKLDTLYIVKPLSGHLLWQALATVNRASPNKSKALIVDYFRNFENVYLDGEEIV